MAFTEFYCQSGGSNVNAGSTQSNTALYTSTNGGWNSGTFVYTPTDGTNPVSAGVAVGMFASVYIDAASVGVFIGRITAVTNASNGTITVAAGQIGAAPSTLASTRTIKVGGAWLGPNAATGFPFTLASFGSGIDSTSHMCRVNLKNDHTYSLTASFAVTSTVIYTAQGYTSSVGDGGKATFDGSTSTATIITDVGIAGCTWVDLIFSTSFASGSSSLVIGVRACTFIRCVFTGARGRGVDATSQSTLIECEAYNNNKSNTASTGAFHSSGSACQYLNCVAHDNTGSNTSGFVIIVPSVLYGCVSETNGGNGISLLSGANSALFIRNCDLYNNTSNGINIATALSTHVWIENCNFVKNGGAGINNISVINTGFVYNCGYGAGTQANGSGDTINNLVQSGTVTYGSNLTPWVDPANGDFRINLLAANFAGRGAFTETASSYAGTIGTPDIGAAQSRTGSAGTFSKEVSYGSAH